MDISRNRTRVYRDGFELEPLMNNENYDFNFQESRKLKEERIIYPVSKLFGIIKSIIKMPLLKNLPRVIESI